MVALSCFAQRASEPAIRLGPLRLVQRQYTCRELRLGHLSMFDSHRTPVESTGQRVHLAGYPGSASIRNSRTGSAPVFVPRWRGSGGSRNPSPAPTTSGGRPSSNAYEIDPLST
jgi:hypothetical protein